MRIAVVGSGISGLSAAWLLQKQHEVTLIERHHRIGMGAFKVDVDIGGEKVPIDIPMRVYNVQTYRRLMGFYEALGVETHPCDHSGALINERGEAYFRYQKAELFGRTVRYAFGPLSLITSTGRYALELARFQRSAASDLARGRMARRTIDDYLSENQYSRGFKEQVIYPVFSVICTCSYEAVRAYPAELIAEFLLALLGKAQLRRLRRGTLAVTEAVSKAVSHVECGVKIKRVWADETTANVEDEEGAVRCFDHVVIATQADEAREMLDPTHRDERALLKRVPYDSSVTCVHRDPSLLPKRSLWGPVTYTLSSQHDRPMATLWINRVLPDLPESFDLFQTVNPLRSPKPELLLASATLTRPLVTQDSLEAIEALSALQRRSARRLWLCGSYAARGIPLLETGVRSALSVASATPTASPITSSCRVSPLMMHPKHTAASNAPHRSAAPAITASSNAPGASTTTRSPAAPPAAPNAFAAPSRIAPVTAGLYRLTISATRNPRASRATGWGGVSAIGEGIVGRPAAPCAPQTQPQL